MSSSNRYTSSGYGSSSYGTSGSGSSSHGSSTYGSSKYGSSTSGTTSASGSSSYGSSAYGSLSSGTSGSGSSSSVPSGYSAARRSPTDSSYYDFGGTPSHGRGGDTWMYARDARAQQAGASTVPGAPYPTYYGGRNKGNPVNLTTTSEYIPHPNGRSSTKGWLHQPLIPHTTTTFTGSQYQAGTVRGVYAPSDPTDFDVVYHARGTPKGDFTNATYYPANK